MHPLLTLLTLAAGIQTGVLLLLGIAEMLVNHRRAETKGKSISLIVAARNESENLKVLIPILLSQDYPGHYEVILALDRCTDDSEKITDAFMEKDHRLRKVVIETSPGQFSPKKYALTTAIRQANYPFLAFTDADCRPGSTWLKEIDLHFDDKADLVLGISPYQKRPGLLNLFIRFETFLTAFLYCNSAKVGFPWMGVGRNLAYRRDFFESAGGFSSHAHLLSGDDDLLINRYAQGHRSRGMGTRASLVESIPAISWKSWFRQKMRHISASKGYSPLTQAVLTIYQGSHALFYVTLGLGAVILPAPAVLLSIYLARTIFHLAILSPAAFRWKDPWMVIAYPLLDPLMVLYNFIMVPAGLIRKPKWKTD